MRIYLNENTNKVLNATGLDKLFNLNGKEVKSVTVNSNTFTGNGLGIRQYIEVDAGEIRHIKINLKKFWDNNSFVDEIESVLDIKLNRDMFTVYKDKDDNNIVILDMKVQKC